MNILEWRPYLNREQFEELREESGNGICDLLVRDLIGEQHQASEEMRGEIQLERERETEKERKRERNEEAFIYCQYVYQC